MQRILTRGLPIAVVFIAASVAFSHLSAIVEDPSASLRAATHAGIGLVTLVGGTVLSVFCAAFFIVRGERG
jgi:hypothetical protein